MASTIRDVARAAGVAVSTVSRALNGSRNIAEPTRVRVLAAAAALHFTPSSAARGLLLLLSSSHGDVAEAAVALRALSARVDAVLPLSLHADARAAYAGLLAN